MPQYITKIQCPVMTRPGAPRWLQMTDTIFAENEKEAEKIVVQKYREPENRPGSGMCDLRSIHVFKEGEIPSPPKRALEWEPAYEEEQTETYATAQREGEEWQRAGRPVRRGERYGKR